MATVNVACPPRSPGAPELRVAVLRVSPQDGKRLDVIVSAIVFTNCPCRTGIKQEDHLAVDVADGVAHVLDSGVLMKSEITTSDDGVHRFDLTNSAAKCSTITLTFPFA